MFTNLTLQSLYKFNFTVSLQIELYSLFTNLTLRPSDGTISFLQMKVSLFGAWARGFRENSLFDRTRFEMCLVNTDHMETWGCWETQILAGVENTKTDKHFSCYLF